MKPSTRYKQTAVIVMAIVLVIVVLWRLHTHPKQFGGIGSFVNTNILGPATLSLISGSEPVRTDPNPTADQPPFPTNWLRSEPTPPRRRQSRRQ